ncbi:aminodeoxychorismate synthase component I [Motiliproteus sp. MSK22-1]|uniref:aminodeoxychorismate synthase component I n=1 Tax=Motiliproteus sp. MSK22-1 TaxID=1897630 RepID=UPI00097B57A4|nr:aminodeoxychorismate synthase component I [Motiliproteus sp. MSK22-1]OMH25247.1 aminodeoxychorismate synthase, component I [Motiliproteus sp. MSK22-1]
MYKIPLTYHPDSSEAFERLHQLPGAALLDSGRPQSTLGRYDILCANPICRVFTKNNTTWREEPDGRQTHLQGTPFEALKSVLVQEGFDPDQSHDLPFNGGALGYFSYDLGRCLESLPAIASQDIDLPEMQIGIYLWAVVVDHQTKETNLVYNRPALQSDMEALANQLEQQDLPLAQTSQFQLKDKFQSNLSAEDYEQRFNRIVNYINAGDCYQVNLAQRFSAPCTGDSWQAYKELRKRAPTPFSAFLTLKEGAILSLSPERFIQVRGLSVETKPIKGTRPRGENDDLDRKLKEELISSPKDRAENLMIVDLLRNDLGRSCKTGSIRVPKLFDIESYANVHHLVTTVEAELNSPADSLRLLEGSFPGGSITGAPKIRAMEIIEELEPHRRSAYCGSIGYIGFNGNVDTSICIRTLVCHQQRIHCWAGGGIVADSECSAEYQETFDKVSNLVAPLEKMFHHS